MIKKSFLNLLSSLSFALLILNACSSNQDSRTFDKTHAKSSYEQMLQEAESQKNVWDSALADESRFKLNITPNAEEKALAASCAKTDRKSVV